MTIPFSNSAILNNDYVEDLLQATTDMPIVFDGYYVVCDSKPEYKKKISIDYDYYTNLIKVFRVLNGQGFTTVYVYSNWDALIITTLCNIDYITIGTYENLRNFNIRRYTEPSGGGASKGWYFSEKLLNFIRAEEIKHLRRQNCLNLIANEKNIFSDIILNKNYVWNTHKPDVHKNYLLAISRLLKDVASISSLSQRMGFFQKKINQARKLYGELYDRGVFLNDESSDYHLGTWDSIIKTYASH
jgi:predicted nucleic acid-binding protein